jgi:peptide/nickel transport system permease protein
MVKANNQQRSPGALAWLRFKENKPSMGGLVLIGMAIVIAIIAPFIIPDNSKDANNIMLPVEMKKPGFQTTILKHYKDGSPPPNPFWQILWRGRVLPYQTTPISSWKIGDFQLSYRPYVGKDTHKAPKREVSLVKLAYHLKPETPNITRLEDSVIFTNYRGKVKKVKLSTLHDKVKRQCIQKKTFWLGTDRFGRDMLSRLLLGTRVSLSVGLIAVGISLLIGLIIGAIGGFFRGWVDEVVQWLINVVWSIPTLLLVISLSLALGKGITQVFIAVGLTMWVEVARVVRGQVISLREAGFVEASQALGVRTARTITHHILPNILGPVIVIAAANFATAILLEAGLSFLGIGVQPPTPAWGYMINDHRGFIILDSAYLAILPGIAIMIMVMAFYLVGNGLRDAFDVKLD